MKGHSRRIFSKNRVLSSMRSALHSVRLHCFPVVTLSLSVVLCFRNQLFVLFISDDCLSQVVNVEDFNTYTVVVRSKAQSASRLSRGSRLEEDFRTLGENRSMGSLTVPKYLV